MYSDLWVRKYAPKTFWDAVGNREMLNALQQYKFEPELMPSLILAGPPGCGKTTAMHILAHELHGDQKDEAVFEINASDQRGIDVVRELIVSWLSEKRILKNEKAYRIVILDEFDNMTMSAQEALRKVMEKYTDRARFALACNYPNKVHDAIISRCSVLKFEKIEPREMIFRVVHICHMEDVSYDASGLDTLSFLCDGDMRKAITLLQSVAERQRSLLDADSLKESEQRRKEYAESLRIEWEALDRRINGHDIQHAQDPTKDTKRNDVTSDVEMKDTVDDTCERKNEKKDGNEAAKFRSITTTEDAKQSLSSSLNPMLTKKNVLHSADSPNPDLLKLAIYNSLYGTDWRKSIAPMMKMERHGHNVRDILQWLTKVLLHTMPEIDEALRADMLFELAKVQRNMVLSNKFTMMQLDSAFMKISLKHNSRMKAGYSTMMGGSCVQD